MNANELLKLISKQWCNISDLMKILGCGRNKALVVKKQIKDRLINEGYIIPNIERKNIYTSGIKGTI